MVREITSLQHPIVKYLVKLRKGRDFRREQKSTLVVGKKLVSELGRDFAVKTLIMEKGSKSLPTSASQTFVVTSSILKKITGVEEPEPYAAEISLPQEASLRGKKFVLVLDGVADPGNLGTLIRTALALGWEGAFLCSGSADPFSEKALRAAKGATFHLPLVEGTHDDLAKLIEQEKFSILLADMDGKNVQTQKFTPPLLLILGSESHGVKFKTKNGITIAIPLHEKSESLNVAIAGGILMYLLRDHAR